MVVAYHFPNKKAASDINIEMVRTHLHFFDYAEAVLYSHHQNQKSACLSWRMDEKSRREGFSLTV